MAGRPHAEATVRQRLISHPGPGCAPRRQRRYRCRQLNSPPPPEGQIRTTAAHYRNRARINHSLSERHWPHLLAASDDLSNLPAVFNNSSPCVLDIGFGKGEALCRAADRHRRLNFIGAELYAPGLLWLCRQAEQLQLDNLKLAFEDARSLLRHRLAAGALSGIQLLFPDPWPKRRQQKRRLIQPDFCRLMHCGLQPGGMLLIATDWPDYAQWIRRCFAQEAGWQPLTAAQILDGVIPPRQQTKFERRALVAGRQTTELGYRAEKLP